MRCHKGILQHVFAVDIDHAGDCTREEAESSPWSHSTDEKDVCIRDWEVESVEEDE